MGLIFAAMAGVERTSSGFGVDGLRGLDAEDVAGTKHIAGEEDERLVGGEADVGLEFVVVPAHDDEVLGAEHAGLDEIGLVDAVDLLRFRAERYEQAGIFRGHFQDVDSVGSRIDHPGAIGGE